MIGFIPFGTREDMPRRTFPIVTLTLVALNVLIFIYQLMVLNAAGPQGLQAFVTAFGTIPARFFANPFDPSLITSMFLHGGFLHLAGNMLFLLAFGDNVEDRLGHVKYGLLYLLWGILGSLAHIFLNPASVIPSVGASGAIAGVLGAYLILFPRGMVRTLFFIFIFFTITRIPAVILIGSWFLMQLFSGIGALGAATAQTGGVAFWAHIGGFIAGFVTALFAPRVKPHAQPVAHPHA